MRLTFVIAFVVILAIGCSSASKDTEIQRERRLLHSDWKAGKSIVTLRLSVLNGDLCVDVVRDYREAMLGFVRLNSEITEIRLRADPRYEIEYYDSKTLFVTIHKPTALKLDRCKSK